MASRRPTADEARLLRALAHIAGIADAGAWTEGLQVEEMDDGGMGSLRLVVPTIAARRGVVSCEAAVRFTDADGVEVVASLNTDEHGSPIELDMWKTHFSRLIRIPEDLRRVEE